MIDYLNKQFEKPAFFITFTILLLITVLGLNHLFEENNYKSVIESFKHPGLVTILALSIAIIIAGTMFFKKISPVTFFNKYIRKGWKHYWYDSTNGNKGVALIGLILSIFVGFIIFILTTGDFKDTTILVLMLIFSDFLLLLGILYIVFFKSRVVEYIRQIVENWLPWDWVQNAANEHVNEIFHKIDASVTAFIYDNVLSFLLVWLTSRILVNILALHIVRINNSITMY